jgi:hypothetical protein
LDRRGPFEARAVELDEQAGATQHDEQAGPVERGAQRPRRPRASGATRFPEGAAVICKFTMRAALADPMLLGHALSGPSWLPWRVLLIAAMGEELTEDERVVFTKLTGREREPLARFSELTAVVGRRGGKSTAGDLSRRLL